MRSGANWAVLWQTVKRVETNKIIPWIALRNTIGVVCPLIAGVMAGNIPAGLVMATGALNVAVSDGKDPYHYRASRMLRASLFCAIAIVVGSATGRDPIAATVVAGCWAFAAGMMVALGTTPGDLGTVSLVVLVVFAAQPMSPHKALLSGLLAFGGGVFQTLLSVVSWLHRRYEPERRALGRLYAGLPKMIREHVDASEAPPATLLSNEAGQALESLRSDYSLEGERYRSLLNQAERLRLSIIAIKRLRARMRRESAKECAEVLDRALEIAAHVCEEVSRLLQREVQSIHVSGELEDLAALPKAIPDSTEEAVEAMVRDARFQLPAMAGQLRAAVSLASHSVGAGQRAFERQEARKPWTLRLSTPLPILRANLSLQSGAFRHALRLACCISIGVGMGRGAGLLRPYWIPMTIAIVLKPDFSSTFSRGVLRLAGTFVGLVVATGLFHVMSPPVGMQIALLAVFMFLYRCFGPANYGILTAAVSGLVVLLIALTGVPPQQTIAARGLNTTMGGLLALGAYIVWPTWERKQLPVSMATLLDAYRKYFQTLTRVYTGRKDAEDDLDECRLEARLARSTMEASVERYRVEPGASPERLDRIMAMLASSHRFAHAAMSLEAYLAANPSSGIPDSAKCFFSEVDRTLELEAATLRGTRPASSEFPDLREAHTKILQEEDSASDLLVTETDRIANSLNTVREQILDAMQRGVLEIAAANGRK